MSKKKDGVKGIPGTEPDTDATPYDHQAYHEACQEAGPRAMTREEYEANEPTRVHRPHHEHPGRKVP